MSMDDSDYNYVITNQGKLQPVGQSRDQSSTLVAVSLRKAQGKSPHSGQNLVERRTELDAKPCLRSSYHRSASSNSRSA